MCVQDDAGGSYDASDCEGACGSKPSRQFQCNATAGQCEEKDHCTGGGCFTDPDCEDQCR